jgi:hypothetical protein
MDKTVTMKEKLYGSGSYFFTHQFVNDLRGGFVISRRFGKDVIGSRIRHTHETQFPLFKPAAALRTKRNFIVGNKIVKRIRFFFGQSCHKSLLLKSKHFNETITKLHRMENANSVIVYRIIHNFKGVSSASGAKVTGTPKEKSMKSFNIASVCLVLLLVFLAGSCDESFGTAGNYKSFDTDLIGTWESNETGVYSGSLKISYNTITIDGYGEDWLSAVGDDSKRPFKDFPKRVPLEGYSETGKIFINYGGNAQSVPYVYTETGTYPSKTKILEFDFGGRKERLPWKSDS